MSEEGMQRPCLFVQLGSQWLLAGLSVMAVVVTITAPVHGQILIHGSGPHQRANIFNTDLAVLESGEQRKDLPCTVTPSKPTLGFDLKFHAGYQVRVQLSELTRREDSLS